MCPWVFLGTSVRLGSVSLVEVGPFFGVPKGWLLPGFCWFSFVSAQFAVLGVIADSEYVDSMGNNRTSILYANSSRPRIVQLDPLQHDQLLILA